MRETLLKNIQLKALYEVVVQHMSDNERNSIKNQQTIASLQGQIGTIKLFLDRVNHHMYILVTFSCR